MKTRGYLAGPAVLLLLMLTACGSAVTPHQARLAHAVSPSGPAGRDGMVTGQFRREGGPLRPDGQQPASLPLSGNLRFTGHQRSAEVRVGTSGRFVVSLPAGVYHVRGRTPSIEEQLPSGRARETWCSAPLSVTVVAGRADRITVTCAVP
jgi:hypothetical protein